MTNFSTTVWIGFVSLLCAALICKLVFIAWDFRNCKGFCAESERDKDELEQELDLWLAENNLEEFKELLRQLSKLIN